MKMTQLYHFLALLFVTESGLLTRLKKSLAHTKERNENMLQRNSTVHKKLWLGLIAALLFSMAFLLPVQSILAASPLKIRYNGKEENFSGQQVNVKLDGKTLYLDKTPGLELINSEKEEIYMVSVIDVFQKGLGAEYKKSGKKITIKKNGITIQMTEGSKTAYVNKVKKTLPYAPTTVTYVKAGKAKLLVPARFVAESLSYGYTWKNNSKTSGTIYMTSPFALHYYDEWHVYSSTPGGVKVYGNNVDVSDMGTVILDGSALVQAKRVFADSVIGASYQYDSSTQTVTLSKNDVTIVMTLGSKTAQINGETVSVSAPARIIKSSVSNNKGFVMVPAEFVAVKLGYHYAWDDSLKNSVISKKDGQYFDWYVGDDYVPLDENGQPFIYPTPEPVPVLSPTEVPAADSAITPEPQPTAVIYNPDGTIETPDPAAASAAPAPTPVQTTAPTPEPVKLPEPNYVSRITGSFQNGKDVVSIQTNVTPVWDITEDDTHIYIKIQNLYGGLEENQYEISDVSFLKGVSLSNNGRESTITLNRKSGINYTVQEEENSIHIVLGTETIKIAIDCGHGSNTPGKRTPPLPFDLDFDGDGIIDVKKGESIHEHTADVGVAKYLVKELERCGFEVYQSAFGDEDVPLTQRQANIKNAGCDYSVSIHFNAIGDGKTFNDVTGTGVFYHKNYPGDSKRLSDIILKHLLNSADQRSIGSNGEHSYAVCNTSVMGTKASVLVECAFMTNLNEVETMMGNADYWKETAQEIAQAFCEYTGVPYIQEK